MKTTSNCLTLNLEQRGRHLVGTTCTTLHSLPVAIFHYKIQIYLHCSRCKCWLSDFTGQIYACGELSVKDMLPGIGVVSRGETMEMT